MIYQKYNRCGDESPSGYGPLVTSPLDLIKSNLRMNDKDSWVLYRHESMLAGPEVCCPSTRGQHHLS